MPVTIEVSREDRAAIRRATRLHGAQKAMMEGAGVSRRAIENARDFGKCQIDTLQKIKSYLAQQNAGN